MAFDAGIGAVVFLVARLLFGGLLAFQGLNHFMNVDEMAGYAQSKGVPAARMSVLFAGGMLFFGGLGIALGVFPAVAAGAVALFLLISTPMMHNFWAVPEDQQQAEMTNFIKNIELLGATLVFLVLGTEPWAYALGIGLPV
ncbi:DoxX family protein [Halobaculum magnesiiphilum]|uniref:DoxX family protein n=1 Tax=Halobaculum magnesiiphilum TaxID=1017351 RepID=A0A8T8WHI7_9EURY|nr:DoxX family protein [Halobaculum magnesiiphilum]QZP39325.1 DoxX family protein [Halobaculum magnesiiphilum]